MVDGRVSTLLALGVGFNANLTGRDNVVLGGLAAGLTPGAGGREVRRHRGVRGARRLHRPADADVLLRDVQPARVLRRRESGAGHPPDRRGALGRRRPLPAEILPEDAGSLRRGADDPDREPRAPDDPKALRRGDLAPRGQARHEGRARRGHRGVQSAFWAWATTTPRPTRRPRRKSDRAGGAARSRTPAGALGVSSWSNPACRAIASGNGPPFDRTSDASVLELGAGLGVFSEKLAAAGLERLVLADAEEFFLARLRETYSGRSDVEVIRAELPGALELGEPVESAVAMNVLEHIEDDVAALRDLAAVVSPGGTIVLWVPAYMQLYGDFDRKLGHVRRYTPATLRAVVESAGLGVRLVHPVNLLGGLAWWAAVRRGGVDRPNPRLAGCLRRRRRSCLTRPRAPRHAAVRPIAAVRRRGRSRLAVAEASRSQRAASPGGRALRPPAEGRRTLAARRRAARGGPPPSARDVAPEPLVRERRRRVDKG